MSRIGFPACRRRTRSCWCRRWTKYLPLEEITIARALRSAGYATASIGKWHLGGEEYYPEKHGFDINVAGSSAPAPPSYFAPYKIATLPEGPKGEYLTDRLGEEAARFIEQHKDKPFFLYLPLFAVHTPIQGKEALVEKYRAKKRPGLKQTNAIYAAMIESMDDAVGRIRRALDELKLTDRTVVVFTSDNGGRVPTTSNHPLRVGKGSCYEGGTRVPLIVSLARRDESRKRVRDSGHQHGFVSHDSRNRRPEGSRSQRVWTA